MMEAGKNLKITTKKQFEVMIDFMVKNPFIAKGLKYAESSVHGENYRPLWENLKEKLNCLGPPMRNAAEWQKVWTDYKIKLRRKLAHNKRERSATGGGSCKLIDFSSAEEQVINLLSLQHIVPEAVVFGVESQHEHQEQQQSQEQQQQQEASPQQAISTTASRKRRRLEVIDNTKEMLSQQTETLDGIKVLLEGCKKYLKRISDAEEKKVQLQEKQVELLETAQQTNNAETDLRIEILKLEKRKLENDLVNY